MNNSVLLFLLNAITILLFCYINRKFTYWQRVNVPYIKPKFPYGNITGMGTTIHHSKLLQNIYTVNSKENRNIYVETNVFTTSMIVPIE